MSDLRTAAENLAGDVYLFSMGEVTFDQVMQSQGEVIRALAEVDPPNE